MVAAKLATMKQGGDRAKPPIDGFAPSKKDREAAATAKWAKLKQGGDRGNQHTGGKSPIGDLAQSATKTRNEAAEQNPLAVRPAVR